MVTSVLKQSMSLARTSTYAIAHTDALYLYKCWTNTASKLVPLWTIFMFHILWSGFEEKDHINGLWTKQNVFVHQTDPSLSPISF